MTGAEVHLANWFFDGARADIAKVVSANPAFQLTHAFSLGSASKPASYNFGAIFANAQVSPPTRKATAALMGASNNC